MKKHEAIKFAYDNYPKGTVFRWYSSRRATTSTGVFEFDYDGDIRCVDGEYVFVQGGWLK